MARVHSAQQALDRPKSSQFVNLKDIKVDFTPDAKKGFTVRTLRLIGLPIEFRQYNGRRRDPLGRKDEKGKTLIVEDKFPDHAQNRSFARYGPATDDDPNYGPCVWAQMGFIGSRRYAWNCLERQDDGTFEVRVLEGGPTMFDNLFKWEQGNIELNDRKGTKKLCEHLGGAKAHEVLIKSVSAPGKLGGRDYIVQVDPDSVEITDEEIEALRAVGEPDADELKAIYKADPAMKDFPEWFTYGHNLEKIFEPTPFKGVQETTPVSQINMSDDDENALNDDAADDNSIVDNADDDTEMDLGDVLGDNEPEAAPSKPSSKPSSAKAKVGW